MRVFEERLVTPDFSFNLHHHCFVGSRVDLNQRIALADEITFLEMNRHQLTVDAALDGDRIDGSDGAQRGDVYPDIPFLRRYRDYRSHRRRTAFSLTGSGASLLRRRFGTMGFVQQQTARK